MKYILILLAILIASTALADELIVGHMKPLRNELLAEPIELDCGLTIREVHGTRPPPLGTQCAHAKKNFFQFMKFKGIQTNNEPFKWSMSLLPEASCYRCLNDTTHRFKYRFVSGNVIGYTDKNAKYSWMISNYQDSEFNTTFVHELFHALSMHYGVYDSHPGTLQQKTETDEVLAKEFTKGLGYGR